MTGTNYKVVVTPMVNNGLGWERSIESEYSEDFGNETEAQEFAHRAREAHDRATIYGISPAGEWREIQ